MTEVGLIPIDETLRQSASTHSECESFLLVKPFFKQGAGSRGYSRVPNRTNRASSGEVQPVRAGTRTEATSAPHASQSDAEIGGSGTRSPVPFEAAAVRFATQLGRGLPQGGEAPRI